MTLGTHKHDFVSWRTDRNRCFPTPGNCLKPDNQIRACHWRSSCRVCVQNVSVQSLGQIRGSPEKREQIEQTSWSLRALRVFMMRFLSASLSGRMGCLRCGLCSMRRSCQVFVTLLFLPAEPRVWEEYLSDERERKKEENSRPKRGNDRAGIGDVFALMYLFKSARVRKNRFISGWFFTKWLLICTEIWLKTLITSITYSELHV